MRDLEELLLLWEEGKLSETDLEDLKARLRAREGRERLFDHLFTSEVIRETLRSRMSGRVARRHESPAASRKGLLTPSAESNRPSSGLRVFLALASCLAVAAGAWLLYVRLSPGPAGGTFAVEEKAPEKYAVILTTGPGVEVIRNGSILPAGVETRLRSGDRIRTLSQGSAKIGFPGEETTMELAGNTEFILAPFEPGKKFDLRAGNLEASVAKQPEGNPMIVGTPQAQIQVLGTRFALRVGPVSGEGENTIQSTRLTVHEGHVRLTRLEDQETVEVPQACHAEAGAGIDLIVRPLSIPPVFLDDFESELRAINPLRKPKGDAWLWNVCRPWLPTAGFPETTAAASVTDEMAHNGRHSLRVPISRDGTCLQFYPYREEDGRWHFMREFALSSAPWQMNSYNRLRFWIRPPAAPASLQQKPLNILVTACLKRQGPNAVGVGPGESIRYDLFSRIPYSGEWHQIILDPHPSQFLEALGRRAREVGYQEHPTAEPGVNGFDAITRLEVQLHLGGLPPAPEFHFDAFEWYREDHPENVGQIHNLHGVYLRSQNEIRVGWRGLQGDAHVAHEVRYAFENIHDLGWEKAQPAPDGAVRTIGGAGENGREWSARSLDLKGRKTVFIAIKPENSELFRQIAVQLD